MERNLRKTRVGTVISDKMDKTIVVAVYNLQPPIQFITMNIVGEFLNGNYWNSYFFIKTVVAESK